MPKIFKLYTEEDRGYITSCHIYGGSPHHTGYGYAD